MIITFRARDMEIAGEWDTDKRTISLTQLNGFAYMGIKLLIKMSIKGTLSIISENMICLSPEGVASKVKTTFLSIVAGLNHKVAKWLVIKDGCIMINPNDVLPDSSQYHIHLEAELESNMEA